MNDSVTRPSLLDASLISGEESTNSGATKSAKWQGMQACGLVTETDTRTLKPGSHPARVIPRTQSSQGSERMDRGRHCKGQLRTQLLWFSWSISLPKVLCRLRHHVCKQLDLHATNFLHGTGDPRLSAHGRCPRSSEAPTSAALAQPDSGELEGPPQPPPSPVPARPRRSAGLPAPHLAANADIKEDHRIDWT